MLFFGAIHQYKYMGLDTLPHAFARFGHTVLESVLLVAGKLWGPWQPYEEIVYNYYMADLVNPFLDHLPTDLVC